MSKPLQFYRVSDLAELFSVNRVTIWRWEKRGELPPRKKISNRCVGWLRSDIEEWLQSRPFADPEAEKTRQHNLETA